MGEVEEAVEHKGCIPRRRGGGGGECNRGVSRETLRSCCLEITGSVVTSAPSSFRGDDGKAGENQGYSD